MGLQTERQNETSASSSGDSKSGSDVLAAVADRPAAGSDGAAVGSLPPGFVRLTLEWGGAGLLVHHSEIAEAKELRGVHGTPRGTSIRYRGIKKRVAVVEQLPDVADRLAAAAAADRGHAFGDPKDR